MKRTTNHICQKKRMDQEIRDSRDFQNIRANNLLKNIMLVSTEQWNSFIFSYSSLSFFAVSWSIPYHYLAHPFLFLTAVISILTPTSPPCIPPHSPLSPHSLIISDFSVVSSLSHPFSVPSLLPSKWKGQSSFMHAIWTHSGNERGRDLERKRGSITVDYGISTNWMKNQTEIEDATMHTQFSEGGEKPANYSHAVIADHYIWEYSSMGWSILLPYRTPPIVSRPPNGRCGLRPYRIRSAGNPVVDNHARRRSPHSTNAICPCDHGYGRWTEVGYR